MKNIGPQVPDVRRVHLFPPFGVRSPAFLVALGSHDFLLFIKVSVKVTKEVLKKRRIIVEL